MEDEGEPLGGTQRVEHQEQGWAERVSQKRLVLRGGGVPLRLVGLQRLLGPGPAGPQNPQAHPGQDRGQPPGQVVDAAGVRPAEPDPCLLNRVLCLCEGPEHPVGHGLKARPAGFELGGEILFHSARLTRRRARM